MRDLNILMLGWGNSNLDAGKPEAWQQTARALAGKAKVNVVLPRNAPAMALENVTVTDLELAELPDRGGSQPADSPFGPPPPFHPPSISLYGTPVHTGQQAAEAGRHPVGEAVQAGFPNQTADVEGHHQAAPTSPAGLHSQIIEYARKASRFARGQHFDGIYAFDWQTFLAAMELRLVSGKKMVLHMHALSQSRPFDDCRCWMLELERQALERAEAILLDSDRLAAELKQQYGFVAGKCLVLVHAIANDIVELPGNLFELKPDLLEKIFHTGVPEELAF